MSLIDILFPEQASAMHLRKMSQQLAAQSRQQRTDRQPASQVDSHAIGHVEDDLGCVTLLLMSLIKSLVKKGVITESDIMACISQLDAEDGWRDGKISPETVRRIVGFSR
ncbi:MAG: hypothetical protein L6Q71_02905 [Planctomycetes bacterium]|nr:hypothetical protein [Planctomycetota bacterium]NUQ34861.1 hypothetical protein [Planctomycetaceae bacterium]